MSETVHIDARMLSDRHAAGSDDAMIACASHVATFRVAAAEYMADRLAEAAAWIANGRRQTSNNVTVRPD